MGGVVTEPDVDLAVEAGGEDLFALGAEGDAKDRGGVSVVGAEDFPAGAVEDLGGLVAAGAGKQGAVGAEGDGVDPVGVVVDLQFLGESGEIKEADGTVGTRGGEEFAVGRKLHVEHEIGGGHGDFDQFAGGGLKDANFAQFAGLTTGGGDGGAVRTEREGHDAGREIGDAAEEFAGCGVPEGDFAITGDGEAAAIRCEGEGGDGDGGGVGGRSGWMDQRGDEFNESELRVGAIETGAGLDPVVDEGDFSGGQGIGLLRHAIVGIFGDQELVEFAGCGLAGVDSGAVLGVAAHEQFEGVEAIAAFGDLGIVAVLAAEDENWGDVATETDFRGRRSGRAGEGRNGEQKQDEEDGLAGWAVG